MNSQIAQNPVNPVAKPFLRKQSCLTKLVELSPKMSQFVEKFGRKTLTWLEIRTLEEEGSTCRKAKARRGCGWRANRRARAPATSTACTFRRRSVAQVSLSPSSLCLFTLSFPLAKTLGSAETRERDGKAINRGLGIFYFLVVGVGRKHGSDLTIFTYEYVPGCMMINIITTAIGQWENDRHW